MREKVVDLVNGALVGEGWGEGKKFSEDEYVYIIVIVGGTDGLGY